MSFSEWITHSNIECEKSVTLHSDFSENVDNPITRFTANLTVDFIPDICIVEQVSYISAAVDTTTYVIHADFVNTNVNVLNLNAGGTHSVRQIYSNTLASFNSPCCANLNTIIPIHRPMVGPTRFTIQSMPSTVTPVGYLALHMRFVKYKYDHDKK